MEEANKKVPRQKNKERRNLTNKREEKREGRQKKVSS